MPHFHSPSSSEKPAPNGPNTAKQRPKRKVTMKFDKFVRKLYELVCIALKPCPIVAQTPGLRTPNVSRSQGHKVTGSQGQRVTRSQGCESTQSRQGTLRLTIMRRKMNSLRAKVLHLAVMLSVVAPMPPPTSHRAFSRERLHRLLPSCLHAEFAKKSPLRHDIGGTCGSPPFTLCMRSTEPESPRKPQKGGLHISVCT